MSRVPIPAGDVEFKYKEQLYALFYELTSEIKGKDIELEEENYINSINTIQLPQLIDYLKETIHILINQQSSMTNQNPLLQSSTNSLKGSERNQYESIINHHEASERMLLKKHFELQSLKEILELRLLDLIKLDKEYRDLKEKVKYEEGRFLLNERKDNEIIIIRTENTILKKTIADLEEKALRMDQEYNDRESLIHQLNENNKELRSEIEQIKKEMKICSNININVNNVGNSTKCSLCGGRYNNNINKGNSTTNNNSHHPNINVNSLSQSPDKNINDKSQFELFNIKKLSTEKLKKKIEYNPHLMNKSTTHHHLIDITSNNKTNQYHNNNSMNMMLMDVTQRDNLINQHLNMNKSIKGSQYCVKIPVHNQNKNSIGVNSQSLKRNLSSKISLSKKPKAGGILYNNQYHSNNINKSYLGSINNIGKG